MELLIKSSQTAQVAIIKTTVMLEGDGNAVSISAEVENSAASATDGVAVSVATKNEVCDVLCEAEAIIGTLAPAERRVLNFKVMQDAKSLYAIELTAKHASHASHAD
jgi:hypothetical protein